MLANKTLLVCGCDVYFNESIDVISYFTKYKKIFRIIVKIVFVS